MMQRDPLPVTPSRRRPSVSFKGRPRTATSPQTDSKLSVWNGLFPEEFCGDDQDQVFEEINHFPEPIPRRRGAKSFSSLRHPVDGLRTLGRRLSVTIRRSSRQQLHPPQDASPVEPSGYNNGAVSGSRHGRSISNCLDGRLFHRRPSANTMPAVQNFYVPTAPVPAPIPGNGLEPPILPEDMFAGSAARAAAAAQNELARAERVTSHTSESKITRDTESGIGIDLRDPEISEADYGAVRTGKNAIAPRFGLSNSS